MVAVVVYVNGDRITIPQGTTIKQLLQENGLEYQALLTVINGSVIPQQQYSSITLQEGDEIEIKVIMGGG